MVFLVLTVLVAGVLAFEFTTHTFSVSMCRYIRWGGSCTQHCTLPELRSHPQCILLVQTATFTEAINELTKVDFLSSADKWWANYKADKHAAIDMTAKSVRLASQAQRMGLVASDLQTVDRLNTFMPNYETSVRELARRYEDMIFSLELFASNADHSMSICQDAFNSGNFNRIMEVIGRLQDDVEALAHKLDLAISASDTTVTLSDQLVRLAADVDSLFRDISLKGKVSELEQRLLEQAEADVWFSSASRVALIDTHRLQKYQGIMAAEALSHSKSIAVTVVAFKHVIVDSADKLRNIERLVQVARVKISSRLNVPSDPAAEMPASSSTIMTTTLRQSAGALVVPSQRDVEAFLQATNSVKAVVSKISKACDDFKHSLVTATAAHAGHYPGEL